MGAEAGREQSFEEIYLAACEDLSSIPWVSLSANPALVAWLDRSPRPAGQDALVVGCGLGDDAEAPAPAATA